VQGAVGHRLFTYTTQVSPRYLETLLGHDPRSRQWRKLEPPELKNIYEQLQRTTSADRLRGIQSYIRKRFKKEAVVLGAFPAISVAVKNYIKFEPYNDEGGDRAGAGTLHLDMSRLNSRIVLDGLARVSGIIELVELTSDESLPEEDRRSLGNLLNEFTIPLVIFAPRQEDKPLNLREMRQLFADFNFKQTSISPTMAMSFDSSDIYIEATKRLGETDVVDRHGGVEMKSASLGAKSTALVALQNLVRFTRGAAEGDQFAEMKTNVDKDEDKRRLSEENMDEFVESVRQFLAGMAASMGSERFRDIRDSVHTTGPGWGALGAVFHDLDVTLGRRDYNELGRKLGQMDMRKSGDAWADIMRMREYKSGPRLTFVGGGHETRQALRQKFHEHLGTWSEFQRVTGASEEEVEVERSEPAETWSASRAEHVSA
jgi:DGQHR domain-containing protein